MKKYIWIGVPILVIAAFLGWLFWASSKPLPGEKIADLGREHVPVGTEVQYNSNPPTSGKHYADWIRAGVYESPKDDKNLVHSLEHGYVVMHYKCSFKAQMSNVKSEEASGSSILEFSEECKTRKEQLVKIYEKKGKRKLIVVSRANLDTNFAISAWIYLDKFNDFDGSRIEKFIDAHRDNGPERVAE